MSQRILDGAGRHNHAGEDDLDGARADALAHAHNQAHGDNHAQPARDAAYQACREVDPRFVEGKLKKEWSLGCSSAIRTDFAAIHQANELGMHTHTQAQGNEVAF